MPRNRSPVVQCGEGGFTLIELVIGMVVLGIALTTITTLIYPQARKSVDPLFQVRGAELANALLNEISGKAFDEHSLVTGGLLRCDEDSDDADLDIDTPCSAVLGMDSGEYTGPATAKIAEVDLFDDVDDYHGYSASGEQLASNTSYASRYRDYQFSVSVFYDGDYDGQDDGAALAHRNAKLIRVTVTLPNDDTLSFATYRSNF